jgi:hypothetical protein
MKEETSMTNRTWTVTALVIALGGLMFGLSHSAAQRDEPPRVQSIFQGPVGRFVVARSSPTEIIVLDTVTGELYSAGIPRDIKAYPPPGRERMGEKLKERFDGKVKVYDKLEKGEEKFTGKEKAKEPPVDKD